MTASRRRARGPLAGVLLVALLVLGAYLLHQDDTRAGQRLAPSVSTPAPVSAPAS